ncbi:MAG: hypothetical protein MHM6MM_005567 [Cercozoa sp. M6MM]
MTAGSLDEAELGVSTQAVGTVRFRLADGAVVPEAELTPEQLENTPFAAQFAGDRSTNVIDISRPEITVAEVQNFAREIHNKSQRVHLPTLARVHNQRFLGKTSVQLFTSYDEAEIWELTLLVAPIIDFHKAPTLCSFDELLGTSIGGLDMFTITVLFRFINRVLNLRPSNRMPRARCFMSLRRSLRALSEYCEEQTVRLLRAKRHWQTNQQWLAGDTDVSTIALVADVKQAKCNMPPLVVPTRVVEKRAPNPRSNIQIPPTLTRYSVLYVSPSAACDSQAFYNKRRPKSVSSLRCDIDFSVIPVLPRDIDITCNCRVASRHAPNRQLIYSLNVEQKDFPELHMPCFQVRPDQSLLSPEETAARVNDYANGQLRFETVDLPRVHSSTANDRPVNTAVLAPRQSAVFGFAADRDVRGVVGIPTALTHKVNCEWLPLDLLQRSFTAPMGCADNAQDSN